MITRIPAAFILAILALLSCAPARAQEETSLKIEIAALPPSVKNTEAVEVGTKIRNVGKDSRRLQVWSCSYPDHWQTDNAAAEVVQVPCDKNALIWIDVKPGEAYERQLTVRVSVVAEEVQQESVTFRLGFKPSAETPAVLWSNAVTVKVTD
ncbi:MAG: hypothetical protein ACAH83_06055 [Alphaproteobacteria bacterium]